LYQWSGYVVVSGSLKSRLSGAERSRDDAWHDPVKVKPSFRWPVFVALLPLMLLGLYVLGMQLYGAVRLDPAYFTPEYVAQYNDPASIAKALERSLQTGNHTLMAALQGRPVASFTALPSLVFVMLQDRNDRYYTYLYVNRETYERYIYHIENIRGRYVVTPSDAYYYLHSGQWITFFVPAAIAWWLIELLALLALWLYRLSARMREQMYGG
jgi:hypothetical protein